MLIKPALQPARLKILEVANCWISKTKFLENYTTDESGLYGYNYYLVEDVKTWVKFSVYAVSTNWQRFLVIFIHLLLLDVGRHSISSGASQI